MVGNTVNLIKLIVYRYKSDSVSWENDFDIVTGSDVFPSQAREIFHNDTVDFSHKDIFYHFLRCRAVKSLATETVINIVMRYRNLILITPTFDNIFLILDKIRLFSICNRKSIIAYCIGSRRSNHFCVLMFSAFSCHEKIPPSKKKLRRKP